MWTNTGKARLSDCFYYLKFQRITQDSFGASTGISKDCINKRTTTGVIARCYLQTKFAQKIRIGKLRWSIFVFFFDKAEWNKCREAENIFN